MRLCSYHGAVLGRAPGEGRVISAHRRALNLRLADDQLLCLVAPELGNGPLGLVVAGEWPLPWPVGSLLRLDAAGLGPLRWADGDRWDPPRLPRPAPPGALRVALRAVAASLGPGPGPGGGALPVVLGRPAPAPFAAFLRRGLASLAAGRWAEAVGHLVGLGPGLTPSGDDLLAGYVLARRALSTPDSRGAPSRPAPGVTADPLAAPDRPAPGATTDPLATPDRPAHGAFPDPLLRLLGDLPPGLTTPLGRHILRWAARGVASEHQMAWLASFLAGRPDPVAPLLAVGATSGSDWLAGVLLAAHHAVKEREHGAATLRPEHADRGGDPGLALL